MALTGLWGKLTSGIFGVGIGVAAADAMEPVIEPAKQKAWLENTNKVLPLGQLAELVAQALLELGPAAGEAARTGYDENRLEALVQAALTVPGTGELLRMLRRGTIDPEQLEHALRKMKREAQYDAAIAELESERLEPAEIAKAIHRAIMRGEGLLLASPPDTPGKVPAVPPSELDPVAEAAASGIDHERLRIMTGNAGLPLGLIEMLRLLNLGEVEESDVQRAIAESNLRNEYQDVALALRRRLLTPIEYVEAKLRAWIDEDAMRAGAALSGMEAADAELLLKIAGRPIAWRQVFIGERRGGTYDGPHDEIDPAVLKALEESNVRPEWYHLAWAQRYTYPSAFVLRSMAETGDLTAAETETILLYSGWEPGLAKKVAAKWAGKTAAGAKAETKAELESEYAGGFITETDFRAALELLGYTGHVQDLLVSLNDARRVASWREKAVTALGKKHIGAGFDAAKATADLAEIGVTGEGGALLVDLWGRESVALAD